MSRDLRIAPARAWILAAAICVVAAAPAWAERREPTPEPLEGVDVEEHLGAQVPANLGFTDEAGRPVDLAELTESGLPVVLVLAYYRCPMLCSLVLRGAAQGLEEAGMEPDADYQGVVVSIDPRDTPERARAAKERFAASAGEAGRRWRFLIGEPDGIEGLAEALGFRYRPLPNGEFAHPAVVFVLTPGGTISRYLYGVRFDPKTVRLALVEAGQGGVGSTLDRVLLHCFQYDPEAGRYTLAAVKLMRIGGALTVVVLSLVLGVFWRRELRGRASMRSRHGA